MLGLGLGLQRSTRVNGFTGLLDLYPNASAAYSLRKLRAAYSGSAVRVRKEVSLVSSETDIGFLGDGTLDTASLLAFASDADSGDVFVVTWYDQSLSNDATQGIGANQPKIVSSGAVITEGTSAKPAVLFDGSSSYLDLSGSISNVFTGNSVYYSFEVAAVSALSKGGILCANTAYRGFFNPPSYDYADFHNPNGLTVINSLNVDITNQFIFSSLFDANVNGGTYSLYGNSALETTDTSEGTSNLDTPTSVHIGRDPSGGASAYLDGKIQEVIFYKQDKGSERADIETNINTFYSIYP